MARLFRDALHDIAKDGKPSFPGPVREAPDGRLRVQVFPDGAFDRITFAQTTAEVWMQPGVTRESLVPGQAAAYADPIAHAGTALVLAAGNVASLGPRDVLSKLFVEGKVVVMKANPVNEYLVPHWSRALAPLIDAGVLRIVQGGAAVGQYLTGHARIDEVHITGSDKTYDAVVFGTGTRVRGARRPTSRVLDKPVTAELGNVSPVIVVPGKWSIGELRYQAEHVATMLVNNAGFNCISAACRRHPRAVAPTRRLPRGADPDAGRDHGPGRAYYPGAAGPPRCLRGGPPRGRGARARAPTDALPWTFIRGVPAGSTSTTSASTSSRSAESWPRRRSSAPTRPRSSTPPRPSATTWSGERWAPRVIVSPSSMREQAVAGAVERAVADLRYGSIGVNLWHGLSFAMGSTTWGAYPGHPRTDIQSGTGVVGQRRHVRPPAEVGGARARSGRGPSRRGSPRRADGYDVMRRFVAFEAEPSAAKIPGLLLAAMRLHSASGAEPPRFSSSSSRGAAGWRRALPRRCAAMRADERHRTPPDTRSAGLEDEADEHEHQVDQRWRPIMTDEMREVDADRASSSHPASQREVGDDRGCRGSARCTGSRGRARRSTVRQ